MCTCVTLTPPPPGPQFSRHFLPPDDDALSSNLSALEDKFRVTKRKYRFKGNESISEEQAVHKVLLEYGESMRSYRGLKGEGGVSNAGAAAGANAGGTRTRQEKAFDKQLADAQKLAEKEDAALDEARSALATKLMNNVEELNDEGVAGRGGVGAMVTMGAGDISAANEEYERKREAMLQERANRDAQKEEFNRRKEGLAKEIESARKLLEGGRLEEGGKAKAEAERLQGEMQVRRAERREDRGIGAKQQQQQIGEAEHGGSGERAQRRKKTSRTQREPY